MLFSTAAARWRPGSQPGHQDKPITKSWRESAASRDTERVLSRRSTGARRAYISERDNVGVEGESAPGGWGFWGSDFR